MTRAQLRTIIRREMVDPSGRWWADGEINYHLDAWQNELQQEMELIWATTTLTLSTSTVTLSTITPEIERLDAVYLNNLRLSGRSLQDVETLKGEWWEAATGDKPRAVVQYDSTQFSFWPPLNTTGTLVLEYPKHLSLTNDTSLIELPLWAQYSAKPYVCSKLYLRPGPVNDKNKAMRYWNLYFKSKDRTKKVWAEYIPERFRQLKPGAKYEADILKPPIPFDVVEQFMPVASFNDYVPTGTIDGVNTIFTLPVTPTEVQIFKNGQLMTDNGDYTLSGITITFTSDATPQVGDVLIAWVFRA